MFTCEDYLARMKGYRLAGGAVVSGSFQAYDQSYLIDALKNLGPGFVGVTQLPASASDEELLRLNGAGVRAVRFNLKRGGSEDIRHLEKFARRVYDLARWHVELYVDAVSWGTCMRRWSACLLSASITWGCQVTVFPCSSSWQNGGYG
ncbi:amidohydrolase family protein [Geotalea toluenoxydans]|uniref:amidohydrolase family protein n=1 Tax=Geotalea toluenoxydans TaxID=421624 RepID=UPI000B328649|nr:amidohydrolase family protein [Geotalea toluenoxydans]